MNSTAAASLWWRVPRIAEQRGARERQHRPHALAAAGDQVAGELGDQRDLALHPLEDDRVDVVHVARRRAASSDRATGVRSAPSRMDGGGHRRVPWPPQQGAFPSPRGQLQPGEQAAQILALLERTCRRRSRRRRGRWRGRGRCRACRCRAGRRGRRCETRSLLGNAAAVILDLDLDHSRALRSTVTKTRPPPYLAAFSIRLPSISSRSCRSTRTCACLVAGEVDGDVLVEPVDRALDRLERGPDRRARLGGGAAADRAGAGEMVVDLAPHRRSPRGSTVSAEIRRPWRWRHW